MILSSFSYFRRLQHNHNVPPPPLSQLVPTSGNTGTTGLRVMINTTQVGQLKGVQMCSDLCRVVNYIVAYDLFPLTSGSDRVLIGATTRHPVNHYGTLTTLSGIRAVASQYHSEFPDYPVIAINDLSLPLGGIFDLNGNWAGPHHNHSRGKAVDIRGNGRRNSVQQIPTVQARFLEICEGNGAIVTLHESQGTLNEHFHCEWPWGSLIQNPELFDP